MLQVLRIIQRNIRLTLFRELDLVLRLLVQIIPEDKTPTTTGPRVLGRQVLLAPPRDAIVVLLVKVSDSRKQFIAQLIRGD